MRRASGCLAAAAALAAAALVPAAADAAAAHNPNGRLLGAVEPKHDRGLRPRMAAPFAAASQLVYHGGPVVHDGHVQAIFWEPPGYQFPADYRAAVARYFADVAVDGGKRTNVYSTVRQYGDAAGPTSPQSVLEGSYSDTNAFPPSGCSYAGTPVCLTDGQLGVELRNFVLARGLPRGLGRQYFLFTPEGVGTCYANNPQAPCAYKDFCAYHSWLSAGGTVLYAIHPYVAGVPSCDVGESPTGTSADPVLNVVSHEHAEILTDPTGRAWFDQDGEENGDKCAWHFGAVQGAPGARHNQILAGDGYLLQQEWSNQEAGCVTMSANRAPWAALARVGPAVAGRPVFFTAISAHDPDGTIASYAWSFGDGRVGSGVSPAHTFAKKGTYQVRLTVTDREGATDRRTLGVVVAPARHATRPHTKHRKHRKKPHRRRGQAAPRSGAAARYL